MRTKDGDVRHPDEELLNKRAGKFTLQKENAKILDVCTGTAANTIYIAERMKSIVIIANILP